MSSAFDVDIESKIHHKPRRRGVLQKPLVFVGILVIFAVVTVRFFTKSVPNSGQVDVLDLADKSSKTSSATDEVAEKNSQVAAAAAAANIQYPGGASEANSAKLDPAVVAPSKQKTKLLTQDMGSQKTVPMAEKGMVPEKQKEPQRAPAVISRKSRFNPSAEFKAIVALSPVVVFTWETTTPIPFKADSDSMEYLESQGSYQSASKELLKTLGEHYQITPVPTYVRLDRHPHFKELAVYINDIYHKLNDKAVGESKPKSRADSLVEGSKSVGKGDVSKRENIFKLPSLGENENILPGIIIAGKPIGNARQLKVAHENGDLMDILKSLGDGIINIERVG